jgi:uncharacterized membrane protein YkoI
MMKKIIVVLVIVVAVLGLGFATIGNTAKKNTSNNTTSPVTQQIVTNTNNTTDNSTNTNITSKEAQKIASKYIAVSSAIAGTPKLVKQDNRLVYIVPVMDNGKNVGEIDIDAQTGENLGGAGGAP